MNEVELRVRPAAVGWGIDSSLTFEPVYFESGGRAELTARSLAIRLANAGVPVRLFVSDRANQVVAIHRYFAD